VVAAAGEDGTEAGRATKNSDTAPAGPNRHPAAEKEMRSDARIRRYLQALGKLCIEVADQPKLVPVFLQILLLVPRTIAELAKSPCG
jgi:hypothetical protein